MAEPVKLRPVVTQPIVSKPDLATIGGLLLAMGGILGGLLLEGGRIRDVAQITAAVIVFGGTLGAVLVTTPMSVLVRAAGKLKLVFVDRIQQPGQAVEEIISFAAKARKHGIVSLERDAMNVHDEFLRKALNMAVDGTDLDDLRKMMELEMISDEHRGEEEAKVFEAAGGYAPTVGILGAVLGLIQVMKHLENIDEVGRGIAVAFVATVYGVGSANLFFSPGSQQAALAHARGRADPGADARRRGGYRRRAESQAHPDQAGGLRARRGRSSQEPPAGNAARLAGRRDTTLDMRKRRPQQALPSHERWLVSYADFITLMFAFFVVMFASSQADKTKVRRVSESVSKALENGPTARMTAAVAAILGGSPDDRGRGNAAMKGPGGAKIDGRKPAELSPQSAELLPSLEYLNTQLKQEVDSGKMRLHLEPRGLVVSLEQATFFPSGEDSIDPATYPSLEKVALAIRKLPNPVRLEGHTDSVPIHTARFRSNWELSAARSIAVLELLSSRFSVPRERLAIAGYAETVPVAPNDSEQGRARNRRVDIVILNRLQALTEPAPALASGAAPVDRR